jgi:NAD(P)-dependent dehydrogenase (short-subunit alcohol dehydrogenase family)
MSTLKVALVTGAGSGVGRASAIALFKAGYSIVVVGRRPEELQKTLQVAGCNDSNGLAVPTDVGQPEQVKALFAKVKAKFGRLDVLFNNAGMGTPATIPLEDISYEQWSAVVAVNLTGMFLCTQQAIHMMKSQSPMGGRIINNGSISAHAPRPGSAPYTSTKHAVSGLTKSTSLDCRKYDIACGQIDIGNAATEMTERMANGVIQPTGEMKVEPRIDVNIVANAVAHMASLPLDANIQTMMVMATKMPFVGRG